MIGDGDILLHHRALRHSGLNLTHHIGIVHTDDCLYRCTGVAIDDVFLRQHVGCGNDDSANLMQGEHDDPPFIATLQNEHHGVVLANAQRHQVRGCLIGLFLQLSESSTNLLALIVRPQDGQSLGLLCCPRVHHVIGEIEVLGNDEFQVLIVIFHRRKFRLL